MSDSVHDSSQPVGPTLAGPAPNAPVAVPQPPTARAQKAQMTPGLWLGLALGIGLMLTPVVIAASKATGDFAAASRMTGDRTAHPRPMDPILTAHLEVGDCVKDFVIVDEVPVLPEVPCEQPHRSEIVGTFTVSGPYPGDLVEPDYFDERCRDLLLAYAPATWPAFDAGFVLPNEDQWHDPDHRVPCLAMSSDFAPRTGSIKDLPQPSPSPSPAA